MADTSSNGNGSSKNENGSGGLGTNPMTSTSINIMNDDDEENTDHGIKRDVQIKWDAGWTAWVSVDPLTSVLMEDMETSTRATRC